jgi:hypothetical protein
MLAMWVCSKNVRCGLWHGAEDAVEIMDFEGASEEATLLRWFEHEHKKEGSARVIMRLSEQERPEQARDADASLGSSKWEFPC